MTRQEILSQYQVNDSGVIKSPGKFEGEMLYAPYFYDAGLSGAYSEDIGSVYFFEVSEDDRKEFPEIGPIYGLAIEESDTGFEYVTEYETKEQYARAVAEVEAHEELNQY